MGADHIGDRAAIGEHLQRCPDHGGPGHAGSVGLSRENRLGIWRNGDVDGVIGGHFTSVTLDFAEVRGDHEFALIATGIAIALVVDQLT